VAGNSYILPAMSDAGLFKGYVIDPGCIDYKDVGRDDIHTALISHTGTTTTSGTHTSSGNAALK
jgi:hypothetical protein